MAFFQIMRNASSAVVPVALRTLSRQRAIHSAVGFAFQSRCRQEIIKGNPFMERRAAFSSSSSSIVPKSKAEENLIKVLDSEIECAVESEPAKEDIVPSGKIPFTIEDNPGEQSVTLRRKYGNEDIKVEAMGIDIADQEGEDDGDNERGNEQPQLSFNVNISKGDGPYLEFNCSAYADEIVIDMMSVKNPKGDPDVLAYEGPAFA
ncbi:hypothetical protein KI387_019313, partial [Taxus chinensis]